MRSRRSSAANHACCANVDRGEHSDSASLAEIKEADYALTPGRYVGPDAVEDDGEPIGEKIEPSSTELLAHSTSQCGCRPSCAKVGVPGIAPSAQCTTFAPDARGELERRIRSRVVECGEDVVTVAWTKGTVEASAYWGRTSTWLDRPPTVNGCERS